MIDNRHHERAARADLGDNQSRAAWRLHCERTGQHIPIMGRPRVPIPLMEIRRLSDFPAVAARHHRSGITVFVTHMESGRARWLGCQGTVKRTALKALRMIIKSWYSGEPFAHDIGLVRNYLGPLEGSASGPVQVRHGNFRFESPEMDERLISEFWKVRRESVFR